MAERQLPKLNVAGSIPVSRSRFNNIFILSPTEKPTALSEPPCYIYAPKLSNTEHTIAPEFSDSASSTLPTVRSRGVLYV